jgi:hypothetical protein
MICSIPDNYSAMLSMIINLYEFTQLFSAAIKIEKWLTFYMKVVSEVQLIRNCIVLQNSNIKYTVPESDKMAVD